MAKRVLAVEDDAGVRQIIRAILEHAGYEVRILESAHDVESVVAEYRPDVLLLDVMLPGRDGLTVCTQMKARAETRQIPIIIASAKGFEGDRRAALKAGAAAFLSKPFKPPTLVQVVEEALQRGVSLTIWGCRGSIAAPERASGRYGGNTTCVELVLPGPRRLIFDAGTGIRVLGNHILPQCPMRVGLFLSHFHWDHLQGLPFFKPLYVPGNEFQILGPAETQEELIRLLEGQMGGAFFPISLDAFRSAVRFRPVGEEQFEVLGVRVRTLYVVHPGKTVAYRVDWDGGSLVFAPDNELKPEWCSAELQGEAKRFAEFAAGAKVLLHDCQYSAAAYERHRGWGHSSATSLASVAAAAGVERVLLFHHDPEHDDDAVDAIHQEFRAALPPGCRIQSQPAAEGETVVL